MTFSDLAQWWNLVFVLPFATALALLLLMTTGLIATELGGDMDVDAHIDAHTDLDIHGDLDAHGDIGDVGHDGHFDGFESMMDFLGIGKLPISIVLMSFCFVWGLTGVVANQILKDILRNPNIFVWPAMGVALVCAVLLTHITARVMGKFMPSGESYGVSPAQMVGKMATVRFRVTESSGTAQLTDNYGNFHEVPCRVKPGEDEFKQGERVVLMEYDEARKVFLVRTDPLLEIGLDDEPLKHTQSKMPPPRSAVRNQSQNNKVEQ